MTEAAAPAALRGAVLARIERPRSRWSVWIAVPLTAAAAVVFAIALRGTDAPAERTAPVQVASAPTAPAAPEPEVVLPVSRPVDAVRAVSRRRIEPAVAAIRTLPELEQPRALTAADIQPDALAIPLLRMTPILTEPLATKSSDDSGMQR